MLQATIKINKILFISYNIYKYVAFMKKQKKEACTARSREVAQPSTDVARDCLISRFGVELDVSSRVWPLQQDYLSVILIPILLHSILWTYFLSLYLLLIFVDFYEKILYSLILITQILVLYYMLVIIQLMNRLQWSFGERCNSIFHQ